MDAAGALSTAASPQTATRREWLGLAVIALPCLIYSMDLTVLNLALPRIAADLRPSSANLLWTVDVYGFFVAGSLVTMGNLGDRIGRRRLLMVGAGAFGVASIAASLSRTTDMLIAARALLGVAGATLAPSTLSLIRNMFLQPRQRTLAIGVWTASFSIGGALGPLLGGVVLQHFRWGSVFLLGVPAMAVLLVAGPLLLPESRSASPKHLDVPSAALSLAAVLSLIYGLKMSVQDGLTWSSLLSGAAGIGVGALFVQRQRRLPDPLIDLGLFRTRAFGVSLAIYLLATLVTFGSYVLVGQYLQLVLGLSPLRAGEWMLPWSASYVVGSFLAPALARRTQPAFVIAAGLVLAAGGFFTATRVLSLGIEALIMASTTYSLGMSFVFTLGIDAIISAAPAERAGAAAAISETGSELGGALGIAVLGSVATAIYRGHLSHAGLTSVPAGARRAALDSLGGAVMAAAQLPPGDPGVVLLDSARAAFTDATQVTFALCGAISAAAAIIAVVAATPRTAPGDVPRRLEPTPSRDDLAGRPAVPEQRSP
jgi:DHA2 family multidrug resistance protein-like MFS transporter